MYCLNLLATFFFKGLLIKGALHGGVTGRKEKSAGGSFYDARGSVGCAASSTTHHSAGNMNVSSCFVCKRK